MSLKLLVNNKDIWDSFVEELDSKLNRIHIQIEQSTAIEDVYRLQGHAACLRRLKRLRDEVNGKSD
jgi:hypothetical protein